MRDHPLVAFPGFRRLFLARLISAAGDKFFNIALAWWVISQNTGREKSNLALLMAITMLPVVLSGPVLGTAIERLGKRTSMIVADACRALLVGTLALLLVTDQLSSPLLYVLCFLTAAFSPLFDSAASASLGQLVHEEKLGAAVATDASVVEVSNVVGALLGSVFIATLGVVGAFAINAASFVISLVLVWGVSLEKREESAASYWQEMRMGFAYLRGEWQVLALLLTFAALNFFAAPLLLFIPMIVRFQLNLGATWVALLELFFASGAVLSAAWLSFRPPEPSATAREFKLRLFVPILVSGCATGALALPVGAWGSAALLFCAGVCVSVVNTQALTAFQTVVPDAMKGRFFALLSSVCFAVVPAAFLLSGVLSDVFSLPAVIAACGAGALALSFSVLLGPGVSGLRNSTL